MHSCGMRLKVEPAQEGSGLASSRTNSLYDCPYYSMGPPSLKFDGYGFMVPYPVRSVHKIIGPTIIRQALPLLFYGKGVWIWMAGR